MSEFLQQLKDAVGGVLPQLLAAIGILVVGWIVAAVAAKIVRNLLARTTVDERVGSFVREEGGAKLNVDGWVSGATFFTIMLLVVIAVFQVLNLTLVTEPLNRLLGQVFEFLPQALGAGILLGIAWAVATILRRVVRGSLRAARVDERLGGEDPKGALATSIGNTVYWLVFLLFLPAVLGALELQGLLGPVQTLWTNLLGFLPNVLGSALILGVGWFVARLVRRIVAGSLVTVGVDRFGERVGLSTPDTKHRLSSALALVVYALILFPVAISALNALRLESLTRPASEVLGVVLLALPHAFAAVLVITLALAIGRLVARVVTNLLAAAGFDRLVGRIGFVRAPEDASAASAIVGKLTLIAIFLFATMEAGRLLGFELLADLVSQFLVFGGHLLLGLLVFAVGLYLANLASATLRTSAVAQAELLARAAWIAIVLLSAAIGLRRMGIANDIVDLAFGLLLGTVAVSVAIAFGLGGREVAADQLRKWLREDPGAKRRVEGLPDPARRS